MNREILFSRGKRLDNGEWVTGRLITDGRDGKEFIVSWIGYHCEEDIDSANRYIECFGFEVDPETVGQKSGLKERPGIKDIWQGDVAKFTLVNFISGKPIATETHMVELRDGMFGVEWGNDKHFMPLAHFAPGTIIEVIGNIHDNLELLEVLGDDSGGD